MTMTKHAKPAAAPGAAPARKQADQAIPVVAGGGRGGEGGLLGLSAAFLVGAAVGAAVASDQPASAGAHVHLSLGDEGEKDHHNDHDCGL